MSEARGTYFIGAEESDASFDLISIRYLSGFLLAQQ